MSVVIDGTNGVTFANGTGALNYYEEGTFTPTIIGTTTAGTGTYSKQVGRYTKIGRLVTVTINIVTTAHTGSGNMRVAGLPFTVVNVNNVSIPAFMDYANLTVPANSIAFAEALYSSTTVGIFSMTTGAATGASLALDVANELLFSLTYEAA